MTLHVRRARLDERAKPAVSKRVRRAVFPVVADLVARFAGFPRTTIGICQNRHPVAIFLKVIEYVGANTAFGVANEPAMNARIAASMPAIATLVIYLSAADAADPGAPVLVRSAQEVLGDQAQVELRTTASELPDSALSNAEPGVDGVANVVWLNSEHRRAAVRCYVGRLHRVVKRELAFDEDADPRERERMLGFVVASLLTPETEQRVEPQAPAEDARAQTKLTEQSPARPAGQHEHFVGMAELVGLGATGIGGSGSGFGASLAGRWLFASSLALRLAAGLRRGDIPEASASSEVDFVGLGLALDSPVTPGSRFSLGGRTSALLLRHEVDHLSADDVVPDRKSRLMPGADAVFEGGFRFSSSAGVVAGVGAELALGHTDVTVKGKEVAEIPALRGLVELGIQARF